MIYGDKNVTTSGTEVRLVATTAETLARWCAELTVTAKSANTNKIFVGGDSSVSTSAFGVSLDADQSHTFGPFDTNCIDLANVWLDATTNGEGVRWVGTQI